MAIRRVGDVTASAGKFLLYGKSGFGKTFACSRIDGVLLLDIENGARSADPDMPYVYGKDVKELFEADAEAYPSGVVRITNVKQLATVLDLLHDKRYHNRFKAVAVDSVTTLLEEFEAYVRTTYGPAVSNRTEPSNGVGETLSALTLQGWGLVQSRLHECVRMFRHIPIHTIFTFQEEDSVTDDGITFTKPQLKGKALLPQIQAMVDFGVRIEIKETKIKGETKRQRAFRCQPTGRVWAKARDSTCKLINEYEAADMNALIAKVSSVALLPGVVDEESMER